MQKKKPFFFSLPSRSLSWRSKVCKYDTLYIRVFYLPFILQSFSTTCFLLKINAISHEAFDKKHSSSSFLPELRPPVVRPMSIVRLNYTLVLPPAAGWLWMIENPIIQYENSWYSKGKWTVPEGLNNIYQRGNYVYIMMQWQAGKNGECNAPICLLPDRPPTSGGAAFTNQGVEKTTLGLVKNSLGLVFYKSNTWRHKVAVRRTDRPIL